jgi:hypothetical protein
MIVFTMPDNAFACFEFGVLHSWALDWLIDSSVHLAVNHITAVD